MSEQRDHPPLEIEDIEDEDVHHAHRTPTPLWKRKGVIIIASVTVVLLGFIFTRSPTVQTPVPTGKDAVIAVQKPYDDALKDNVVKVAAPATVMHPPPPSAPAPPFGLPAFNPPKPSGSASTYTAMASYPVKLLPDAPPKEEKIELPPARTTLDFKTAALPGSRASPAVDEELILRPGLLVCVLDVAIDSNLPGPLKCHTPGPVYSPKGVILMEALTDVFGKYESMKQDGVNRLQAVSTFAVTPNGVYVPLNGQPLADGLGRTGLSASIDHRYIERFGGAILLDLSQTAAQVIQADISKGGNTYLNLGGSNQLANQILQSTINLPPVGTKNQGAWIALWLTEPISFRDSYRVAAKQ